MGSEKKTNFLLSIFSNVYIKNIFLMIVASIAIVALALWGLKTYTKHNDSIEVPDLKGMQVQDVKALISSSKLKYEVIDSIYNKDGTPGSILEQIPAGKSKVKEGRKIYLTVQSVTEPLIAVPDLEDNSLRQSESKLKSLGFTNIKVVYIPSEYKDLVYSIQYKGKKLKAGEKIPKGAQITINVGNGSSSSTDTSSVNDETTSEDTEGTIEEGAE